MDLGPVGEYAKRHWWLGCVVVALTAFTATSAMAQTVVEKRLAALQPCRNLKLTQKMVGRPVTLAIDKLISVTLSRATVKMAGDDVILSFVGGVSCETSEQSAIKGDASVDLTASAVGNLADCSIRSLSITPTRFGGSLGEVVKGTWEPLIRPKIEADARTMLVDACTKFVTGR
jgi:hypothetical protein